MGLFSKKEKKLNTTCSCGGQCGISDVKNARFIVLGTCCKRATETFENAKKAVSDLGLTDEVINVGDTIEIAKYGVMQTPALVVNSKVVSQGKLLSVQDIKTLIEKEGA